MHGFIYARDTENTLARVVARGWGWASLPILGFYFVQTGDYDWVVLTASIPSGILVHNLLLLNEFPDVEADRMGGRKTDPRCIRHGCRRQAFQDNDVSVYIWIVGCVLATLITGSVVMPVYCLLALLTLPLARKAMKGSKEYKDRNKLVPALGSNVMFILLTQSCWVWAIFWKKFFPIS